MNITKSLFGFLFLLIIDNIYLKLNKDFYKPIMDDENISIFYAILSWMTIIVAINLLVLSRTDLTKNDALIYGAYLGFSLYALWNTTNYSLYPSKWTPSILLVDTMWGTTVTAIVSYAMFNYF